MMLQSEGPKSKIWITDSGKLNLKPEGHKRACNKIKIHSAYPYLQPHGGTRIKINTTPGNKKVTVVHHVIF